ncbi:MAG: low molecular weight phosphatase family protein [Aquificae bacterium]|nr:low molecular weight phosphatase family protein [Aquificota bacterium]
MRIGFVCKEGVRACVAEAVTRKLLENLGTRVEVFSAGLEPRKELPPLLLELLKEKGYPVRGLYPKPLKKIPYKKLDVLVVLDNEIKDKVEFVSSHKRRETLHVDKPAAETRPELERLISTLERELKLLFGFEKPERKGA